MSPIINVAIHSSQFPERVQADLRNSLRRRVINHKFHYDSYKQTQKWLELHQAYSPSRTDSQCGACYDAAFAAAAKRSRSAAAHLIGLGCGGGQKDARLLGLLKERGRRLFYTPVDASVPMVLVARQTASSAVSESHPLVCDLSVASDLPSVFANHAPPDAQRLITFFGMMPNFEPQQVLPKLAALLRQDDLLLLSANLAPGNDYATGVARILPLYDNSLTTDWLLTFLFDLGVERTDGAVEWRIEPCPSGNDLLRVAASFRFDSPRKLRVSGEEFRFGAGEKIGLFFSYRYTPEQVRNQLHKHGVLVEDQWVTDSGEEGVFLCRLGG